MQNTRQDGVGAKRLSRFALGWRGLCFLLAGAGCFGGSSELRAQAPPLTHQGYLKASVPVARSLFGEAVAVSGDLAVVGAYSETGGGAAHVFVRTGTNWNFEARLTGTNAHAGSRFGWSLALDGKTLVVGDPGDRSAATGVNGEHPAGARFENDSGAAYVFVRSGTNWMQQAFLKASHPEDGDFFGGSVAVSGNWIAAGAFGEDSAATGIDGDAKDNSAGGAGAVYLFSGGGEVWVPQSYVKASDTAAGDLFGFSVALAGSTLVAGAPQESSPFAGVQNTEQRTVEQEGEGARRAGAAYVFTRSVGDWRQQAYLKASNSGAEDEFGSSVAISGETAVIGAPGEDSDGGKNENTPDSGAAYVFRRNAGTWSEQAKLKAADATSADFFGEALAASGASIVAGVARKDGFAGAAYVFGSDGTNWSQQAKLRAPSPLRAEYFGEAVAVSGRTILAGAPQDSSSLMESGAAHVFAPGNLDPEIVGPEIVVEAVGRGELASGVSRVDFGTAYEGPNVPAAVQPEIRFVIRNAGTDRMLGISARIEGADAQYFTVSVVPSPEAAPGAEVYFGIKLLSGGPGAAQAGRAARLAISSNDRDENPFLVELTGRKSFGPPVDQCALSEECFLRYLVKCLVDLNQVNAAGRLAAQNAGEGLALGHFHALEALLGETGEGRRLAELYWRHSAEAVRIAETNAVAAMEGRQLIKDFQPAVMALLKGDADEAVVTQQMVDQVNRTWAVFAAAASTELKIAVETERARFDGLQDFAGANFAEWAGMLGVKTPAGPHLRAFGAGWSGGIFRVGANAVAGLGYSLWKSPAAGGAWSRVADALIGLGEDGMELSDTNAAAGRMLYQVRGE